MSAKVYFMKRVEDCKRCVYNVSARRTVKTDKFTLFVYCNFLVLLSTNVCSQNINKQIVNIADETLTDYSFLSRYHYTKSKNCLKRRYRIVTEFPCLLKHPVYYNNLRSDLSLQLHIIKGRTETIIYSTVFSYSLYVLK